MTLRIWQLGVLSGLLQTEDRTRCPILARYPGVTDEQVAARLAARLARQAILTRDEPAAPMAWFLVDEAALRRCVGAAETHGHSACPPDYGSPDLPNVTIQVVPNIAHAGADRAGSRSPKRLRARSVCRDSAGRPGIRGH